MAKNAVKHFRIISATLLVAAALTVSLQPVAASDENRRDRNRFYGIVEKMPEERSGTWIIGGMELVPGPRTQFDETEGPLRVGGCAKVDIRQGRVHEIDSEPMEDCR